MKKICLGFAAAILAAGLCGPAFAGNAVTMDLSAAKTVKKTTTVKRTGAPAGRNVVVVNRGYRAWGARPYYGTAIIGGVALGTIVAVSAAHAVPVAPGPNACWYWSDPSEMHGYWDYCTPP